MELRNHIFWGVALLLNALVQTSTATVSFQDIQAIVGFSTSCTIAYETPVSDCDINDFPGIGGTGSCSSDCEASLEAAETFIQRSCRGQQADADSLIGKLFTGEVCGCNDIHCRLDRIHKRGDGYGDFGDFDPPRHFIRCRIDDFSKQYRISVPNNRQQQRQSVRIVLELCIFVHCIDHFDQLVCLILLIDFKHGDSVIINEDV
ncbi:uncharacterized protein Z518_02894 [Rhinocladiella mackenziei CBS 650.93]|uniref:Uncharacterized protein n=1 Tax=Rhinocladiella mackenziei CBS 650.93 TaxID=1442369 RepID=A0A0D2HCP3_9EURO|nr:uncharacterized protein Z518_02894 [Rhinocladiella mackenziei CBS 650.93]KIX08238.1 hypothetical protein Z518_02894 [Rhinocladiella mackenziei CBS 650.93]